MNIETQLVEESINGDQRAFETLVSLFDKKVYNYCFRMTNDAGEAEDLAQEVFIKVYRNLGTFRKDSKFSTWIYRIAYNTCVDNHRKKKFKFLSLHRYEDKDNNIDIPAPQLPPEEQVISNEQYSLILECIAKLNPKYKSAIILRDIQNYSYQEIADILNLPMGTVKSNISRARKLLRNALRPPLVEDDKGGS